MDPSRAHVLLTAIGLDASLLIRGWHPRCHRLDPWVLVVHLARHLILRGALDFEVADLLLHPLHATHPEAARRGLPAVLEAARDSRDPEYVTLLDACTPPGGGGDHFLVKLRFANGRERWQVTTPLYRSVVLATFGARVAADKVNRLDAVEWLKGHSERAGRAGHIGLVITDPTRKKDPVIEWFPAPHSAVPTRYEPPPWWAAPLDDALHAMEQVGFLVDREMFEAIAMVATPTGDSKQERLRRTSIETACKTLQEAPDGRLRFRLRPAEGGRISTCQPAVGNFPRAFRTSFLVSPGMALLVADIHACQPRLGMHMSGDAEGLRVFEEFGAAVQAVGVKAAKENDIYARVGGWVGGTARPGAASARDLGKKLLLPLLNGAKDPKLKKLGAEVGWKVHVPTLRSNVEAAFPVLTAWLQAPRIPLHGAYVTDPTVQVWESVCSGRYRSPLYRHIARSGEAYADNEEELGERKGPAAALQAAEGDVLRMAIVHAHEPLRGLGGRLVMPLHDALITEVPVGAVEEAGAVLVAAVRRSAGWCPALGWPGAVEVMAFYERWDTKTPCQMIATP